MSPFEKRMFNHPLALLPSRNHPAYKQLATEVNRIAQMDIAFQAKFKEMIRRLPLWAFARSTSGSGFLMAATLRWFFTEYLQRILEHGPDSLPLSFNVLESFLMFDGEFLMFDVREEREHLLSVTDYFDWYPENGLPRDPRLLIDVMDDGIIYSYDMVNDPDGYHVKTPASTLVIAGLSLVRHSTELSCLLVAGENPPYPTDKEIEAIESAESETTPGRESIEPDRELTVRSRYLDRFPSYGRLLMLTRFDLSTSKYDVRYANVDLGKSYRVLTDDSTVLDDLPSDSAETDKQSILEELGRYKQLFSALASLIYLPILFVDKREQTNDSVFKTEFHTLQDEQSAKEVIKEFSQPVYRWERTIKCLRTRTYPSLPAKTITPPELSFERDGYWRPLGPGEVGRDKKNNPIAGRSWVSRLDSWSAQPPSAFLLAERPAVLPDGDDPGVVYIVRSPSHEPEIYKVGLTRRTAESRAAELSGTSAPLPFGILGQWAVGSCKAIEQEVHRRLDAYRVNPNREFFHCELTLIVATVEAVIKDLASKN